MFLCACVNYVNKLIPIKSGNQGIITEWNHLLTREKKSSNLEKIDNILTSVSNTSTWKQVKTALIEIACSQLPA